MTQVVVVDSGEPKQKHIRWRLGLLILAMIFLLAAAIFVVWALIPVGAAMPEALLALESDDRVTVSTRAWIAFVPNDAPPSTGLILYPGARVPAEAYAPLARMIATKGYLVVIAYPTLNLAILSPDAAEPIMQHFSAIEHWVLAGHSLGGVAAASFASSHQAEVAGLIFLASYPSNNSLKQAKIPVLSVYATNDLLAPVEQVEASKENLPVNARFIKIVGGNHGQFAYYGKQGGDGEASISREEQIGQTVDAILNFLSIIASR